MSVHVYAAEETITDCFKCRKKLGLDVALEALRLWRQQKRHNIDRLMTYARICHVEQVMRPYVEALM